MSSVFVHSLFRSASTYFYSILLSDSKITCFQEALHEYVYENCTKPTMLTKRLGPALSKKFRHPDVSYWSSLAQVWPAWVEHVNKNSPVGLFFVRF